MAAVTPQIPDKAKEARNAAAAANAVPELKAAVVTLTDALDEIKARVARLESRA